MNTVLFAVNYLIEDVEDNLLDGSAESEIFYENIALKLSKESTTRTEKIDKNHAAKWAKSSFVVLDPKRINCGKCVKCGAWVTDKEKENPIDGLSNGATVNGELLCGECLPKGHRWSF